MKNSKLLLSISALLMFLGLLFMAVDRARRSTEPVVAAARDAAPADSAFPPMPPSRVASASEPLGSTGGTVDRDAFPPMLRTAVTGPDEEGYIKRSRLVVFPAPYLADVPSQSTLVMDLFADVQVNAVFDRVRADAERFLAVGRIQGVEGSEVLIASREGVIAASIVWPGKGLFEIRYAGDGQHRMMELDPTKLPGCGTDPRRPAPPNALPAADDVTAAPATGAVEVAAAGTTVDVLVVYTAQARTGAGGTAAINTVIDLSEAQTNLGYSNSQIDGMINVVRREEIAYTESGSMFTDLDRITSKGDGFMDNVHTLRDTYGADLVVLLTQNAEAGLAGLAWVMCNVGPAFEANGFSVTRQQYATQQTFSHEIGHNLGSAHDHDNAGSCQAYVYSFGHRFTGSDGVLYHTVMAYEAGVRISYFSNPNVNYLGTPTGVAGTGPTAADNARSINNTLPVVAAFRGAVTPPGGPNPPSNLTATAFSETQINLTWADNSIDETSFEVQRSPNGSTGWTTITTTGANATSYSHTGLTPNTTYYYRVRAANTNGNSAFSNVASAKTLATVDTSPPTVPSWVVVTPLSTTAVQVSWQRSVDSGSGLAGYRVYSQGAQVANTTDLVYQVTGLTPETTVCFTVAAYDQKGNQSLPSNPGCGTTLPEPPFAPSGLAAALVSSTRARVSWVDNATNEIGVDIERSPSMAGPWTHFASTGPDSTSVVDFSLASGVTYYYRARAFNLGGMSPYSDPASVTTGLSLDTTPPTVPTGVSLMPSGDDWILDWNPSTDTGSGVAGYRIYRDGKLHAATSATDYVALGLPGGRAFCLTITAYDAAGNESAPSSSACGVMPEYPSAAGEWAMAFKGSASGLAYVTLVDGGVLHGYGMLASVCSGFDLTGTWFQVSADEIVINYQLDQPGCPGAGSIVGQARATLKQGILMKGKASDNSGSTKWSGTRVTHYPDPTGEWSSQSRVAGNKVTESLSLAPTAQDGIFEVSGGAEHEGYQLSGWMMVTPANQIVAWLRRVIGGDTIDSYYTGKIDLFAGLLKAKGGTAAGSGEKLKAERQ